jgi:hypothetical protein
VFTEDSFNQDFDLGTSALTHGSVDRDTLSNLGNEFGGDDF